MWAEERRWSRRNEQQKARQSIPEGCLEEERDTWKTSEVEAGEA